MTAPDLHALLHTTIASLNAIAGELEASGSAEQGFRLREICTRLEPALGPTVHHAAPEDTHVVHTSETSQPHEDEEQLVEEMADEPDDEPEKD